MHSHSRLIVNRKVNKIIDSSDLHIKPLAEAETIPSSWYTDPAILALEREAVFALSWQLAAHRSQLREHGSRLPIDIAGEPVLLVRENDMIHSMYNVCRHRGGPLATEYGCANALQCQYHGWTYDLDGALRTMPEFGDVKDFPKSDIRLPSISNELWNDLLFVRLTETTPPLAELLDGIAQRSHGILSDDLDYHTRESYTIDCNWKLYIDNYLEGYHVPFVHPELFKMYDYREYKTEVRQWYSFQHSPLRSGGEALYFFIWPNLMLNILPGRLQTNLVYPINESKCIVHFDYYYAPDTPTKMISDDLDFSHRVQLEDIDICQRVQRGVASRSYDKGRFSVSQEEAVYHFQNLLKESLKNFCI
jgi:choline monooxygenase